MAASTALILIGIAAACLVAVLVRARFYPYGPCPACSGRRGRSRGSTSKAYGRCGRCGGKGERIRPLARIIYPRWRDEAKGRGK